MVSFGKYKAKGRLWGNSSLPYLDIRASLPHGEASGSQRIYVFVMLFLIELYKVARQSSCVSSHLPPPLVLPPADAVFSEEKRGQVLHPRGSVRNYNKFRKQVVGSRKECGSLTIFKLVRVIPHCDF